MGHNPTAVDPNLAGRQQGRQRRLSYGHHSGSSSNNKSSRNHHANGVPKIGKSGHQQAGDYDHKEREKLAL